MSQLQACARRHSDSSAKVTHTHTYTHSHTHSAVNRTQVQASGICLCLCVRPLMNVRFSSFSSAQVHGFNSIRKTDGEKKKSKLVNYFRAHIRLSLTFWVMCLFFFFFNSSLSKGKVHCKGQISPVKLIRQSVPPEFKHWHQLFSLSDLFSDHHLQLCPHEPRQGGALKRLPGV